MRGGGMEQRGEGNGTATTTLPTIFFWGGGGGC